MGGWFTCYGLRSCVIHRWKKKKRWVLARLVWFCEAICSKIKRKLDLLFEKLRTLRCWSYTKEMKKQAL